MNFILGIFFILHGLVHLLYAGQSLRLFELRPGMTWPTARGSPRKFLVIQPPGRWQASGSC